MAEHPYMPFFPEKFFVDTAHVPGDAAAYYMVLLAHAWNRGGSLPNDPDRLRLMTRCYSKAWDRIWRQIAPFWVLGEDHQLHQKRLDKEWARAVAQKANASATRQRKWHQESSKRKNPDGKKPNDSTRAPARVPHTHNKKEEDARMTRANPPVLKNGQERGARYAADRKPSLAELARRKVEERQERGSSGEGGVCHLQLVQENRR